MIFGGYQVLAGSPQIAAAATAVQARVASIGFSNRTGFILLGLFYAGLHSWLEEFYWPWFVFGRLRELVPPAAAIVVSSLGFMAHHVIVLLTYFPVPLAIALSAAVAFAAQSGPGSTNVLVRSTALGSATCLPMRRSSPLAIK